MTKKSVKSAKPTDTKAKRLSLGKETLKDLGSRGEGPKGGGSKSRQGIGC